jgi:SAM-dependent methyltransferase
MAPNSDSVHSDLTNVPATHLLRMLAIKIGRRLLGAGRFSKVVKRDGRYVWTVGAVSNSLSPEADFRNYYDQRNIRNILAGTGHRFRSACEVGCGYGRVLPVLGEFADQVLGLEREPQLRAIATKYIGDANITVREVARLDEVGDLGPFDLTMTCTVLQHLTDEEARATLQAMKRATSGGTILLVEKSADGENVADVFDEVREKGDFLSRSRTVQTYREWLAPFELVAVADRVLEASYPGMDGRLMLFRSPGP